MGGAGVRGVAYLTRALCLFALAYAIILFVIVFFFILAHFFVGLENAMYRFLQHQMFALSFTFGISSNT